MKTVSERGRLSIMGTIGIDRSHWTSKFKWREDTVLGFGVHNRGIRIARSVHSCIVGQVDGLRGFFRSGIRTGTRIGLGICPGGAFGIRMAVPLPCLALQTRRASDSVCNDVSLIASGLRHRVHGCGAGIGHGSHRGNCGGVSFMPSIRSRPIDSSLGVMQAGRVSLGPVSPRRTILRVSVLKRSFFIFRSTRAGNADIMCHHGSNHCNLVRVG